MWSDIPYPEDLLAASRCDVETLTADGSLRESESADGRKEGAEVIPFERPASKTPSNVIPFRRKRG